MPNDLLRPAVTGECRGDSALRAGIENRYHRLSAGQIRVDLQAQFAS